MAAFLNSSYERFDQELGLRDLEWGVQVAGEATRSELSIAHTTTPGTRPQF